MDWKFWAITIGGAAIIYGLAFCVRCKRKAKEMLLNAAASYSSIRQQ